MGWETRRGGRYYYRARRVGGRVVKQYMGAGPLAEMAAAWAEEERADRLAQLEADRRRRRELDDVAQQVGEASKAVDDVAAAVKNATEQFKATNDVPALFIGDRCLVNPNARVAGGELYAAYRGWCEANGYRALASNNAAREWERLGYKSMRSMGRVYWQGLGLALEPK